MSVGVNVLQRKLRRASTARSPLPDTDFVGQTLARQIEKGLRPLVKAGIGAAVLEAKVAKVAEAVQDVASPSMLGIVEIESSKSQGLLIVDADLAYHLTDLMLGGDPDAGAAPSPRPFTPIDAALNRLVQDAILAALSEALAAAFARPLGRRLGIVAQSQDIAQVRFAPQHGDVLVYALGIDLGPAGRSGKLRLFLPLAMLDVICALMQDKAVKAPVEEPSDLWKAQMRRAAAAAPVVVYAVLHSRRISVDGLMALRPGDVLHIPAAAASEIQLLIAIRGGRRGLLATGTLGAHGEFKAVKLDAPLDEALRDELRRIL